MRQGSRKRSTKLRALSLGVQCQRPSSLFFCCSSPPSLVSRLFLVGMRLRAVCTYCLCIVSTLLCVYLSCATTAYEVSIGNRKL